MSSSLMDTSPGGESDQYESIKTVTSPHPKDGGQLGQPGTQVDTVNAQQTQQKAEKGAKVAENMRYGQTISEAGMGGQTTESVGHANQGSGFKGNDAETGGVHAEESRRDQGYGPGSGVGA